MNEMISAIVPVYNCEKYLYNCVNSILVQSYPHFEVLLIDDGSSDSSLNICKRFVELDDRVRVFHKSNSGPSDTRNVGLDNALGDYIIFVDSDDVIDSRLFERMLIQVHENKDTCQVISVGVNYLRFSELNELNDSSPTTVCNETVKAKDFFSSRGGLFVWGILYKRKIIEEHNLRFDSCLNYCEDMAFNSIFFSINDHITFINNPLYFYRNNPESILHKMQNHYQLSEKWIDVYNSIVTFTENTSLNKKQFNNLRRYLRMSYNNIHAELKAGKGKAKDYKLMITKITKRKIKPTDLKFDYIINKLFPSLYYYFYRLLFGFVHNIKRLRIIFL